MDEGDALNLIRQSKIFGADRLPAVKSVTSDVDVSKLDQRHIVPNMHPPDQRGIWFSKGFSAKY